MISKLIEKSAEWDSFIDECPDGLIFHKWDFLKIVEKYSNCRFLPIGIYNGEALIGLIPLFHRKGTVSSVFSCPPGSGIPYSGFLVRPEYTLLKQFQKESLMKLFAEGLEEKLKELSADYVSILTVPDFSDMRAFSWKGYGVTPRYSYFVNIEPSLSVISQGFRRNLRNQIKKAEHDELDLVQSNEVDQFYQQLSSRYRENGFNFPIRKMNFLNEIFAAYPHELRLYYLVNRDRERIGGFITQHYKRLMIWMGTPKIREPSYANDFGLWKLIQIGKLENYKVMENMGANKEELCTYKVRFNPTLKMYFLMTKRDLLGKLAEEVYINIFKKRIF